MNTSMAFIPGMQLAVPPQPADWSRKVSGDGGDSGDNSQLPRFELPESASTAGGIVPPDSRALDPRSDRTDADNSRQVTVAGDKDISSDHQTRPRRAADQKSAKSDVDQASTSVNPWVQGQPAANADTGETDSDTASGSAGGGAADDSGTSTATIANATDAAAALIAQLADGGSSSSSTGGGAVIPLQAAANPDAKEPSSPLASLLNLWSQVRSAQPQTVLAPGTQAASADGAASAAITVTVASTPPVAAAAAPTTNAKLPQGASAQSVASLLQMLGGSAAATPGALTGVPANDSGDDQAAVMSATAGRVNAAVSFLLSAMPGSGKGGENRKEDGGFKDLQDLLAAMPSANNSPSAVPDAKANANALLAGIQGLAVSGHAGGGTSGASADSTNGVNQPPLMLNSSGWEDSLTDRVHMLLHTTADGEANEARIQLHPREMGSIQIHVRMGAEGADVRFAATNPDVRHALETSLPRLRELLSAGGMSLTQAQVGSQFSQNSQQSQARSTSANSMVGANSVSDDDMAAPRRIRVASVSLIDDYA